MNEFKQLGISDFILKSLPFEHPTDIQKKAIPAVLDGKDIIAGSATGSGKTLAFSVGIIQHAEKGAGIQALVLTPTRELAEQVATAIKEFSKHQPLGVTAIYGGVSINPQINQLQRVEIVVGTPGRILDHIDRNTINLSKVNTLVLDEADRMLDMGFIDDVEKIIKRCSKERQTLLFSATIGGRLSQLAQRYMKNPVEISVESYVDSSKLKQVYYDVPDNLKFSLLVHLLKKEKSKMVMVFCNTQRNTDFVAKNLKGNGVDAIAIHGGFSQDKRTRIMKQFHSRSTHVLVCTDVAARGLDLPDVSHVYNYDLPKESKQYVHRIGRTARAGKEGIAVNILASRDYENFTVIQRDSSLDIKRKETPQVEKVQITRMEDRGFSSQRFGGRSSGRRPSGGDRRGGGRKFPSRGRRR